MKKKMTLFFNQYQYVCDKNKKLIIDDYIKFEDLDTQWRPLSKKLLNESKLDQIRTLINPKRLDLKKLILRIKRLGIIENIMIMNCEI